MLHRLLHAQGPGRDVQAARRDRLCVRGRADSDRAPHEAAVYHWQVSLPSFNSFLSLLVSTTLNTDHPFPTAMMRETLRLQPPDVARAVYSEVDTTINGKTTRYTRSSGESAELRARDALNRELTEGGIYTRRRVTWSTGPSPNLG